MGLASAAVPPSPPANVYFRGRPCDPDGAAPLHPAASLAAGALQSSSALGFSSGLFMADAVVPPSPPTNVLFQGDSPCDPRQEPRFPAPSFQWFLHRDRVGWPLLWALTILLLRGTSPEHVLTTCYKASCWVWPSAAVPSSPPTNVLFAGGHPL